MKINTPATTKSAPIAFSTCASRDLKRALQRMKALAKPAASRNGTPMPSE